MQRREPAPERIHFGHSLGAQTVCTPSRSVLCTGRHIQHTRMFDNTNRPWVQSMSTDLSTVGDMLRDAGYYTACKGEWHLIKEFETVNKPGGPTKILTEETEAYSFSDYFGVGGIIAHTQGGYPHDVMFHDTDAAGRPAAAVVDEVRAGELFNYDMFAYLDGHYTLKAVAHIQGRGDPKKLKDAGIVPDMLKRGAVRSVFDGRYVFSRCFSPKQHN